MESRDFAYWLMGFFELSNPNEITKEQVQIIKNHLNLVFAHEIDPSIDNGDQDVKNKLNIIHNYKPNSGTPGTKDKDGVTLRC